MIEIIKFGKITEEDGALVFQDFHIDGHGTNLSAEQALLTAMIDRLAKELHEYQPSDTEGGNKDGCEMSIQDRENKAADYDRLLLADEMAAAKRKGE